MLADFYQRFGRMVCIVALLCAPMLWYSAVRAFQTNSNNVLDWLPPSFDETVRLAWFAERFGSDEILVASWPGCTINDQRLDQLAATLLAPVPADRTVGGGPPLFRYVFTGRQTLEELTSEPLSLTRKEALDRMQGWLLGPDGQTTCAVALVSEAGSADRRRAVESVYSALEAIGVSREEVQIGGPTADGAAIDEASQRWVGEMVLLAAGAAMLVAGYALRSWRLMAILFFTALFAWGASLSVLYASGVNMDAVMLMMPGLVFVVSVSGGVHLANYFFDAVREEGLAGAPARCVARGWLPCTLASVTTAMGLGSLALSSVAPVARFGVFSAIGVLVSLASLLTIFPSALQWFIRDADVISHAPSGNQTTGPRRAWWYPLFYVSSRRPALVLGLAAMAVPAWALGVARINTSVQIEDLLYPSSPLVRSYRWLQVHIGPLVPVEVVVSFPANGGHDPRTLIQRAETIERLRQRIEDLPHVGGTVAATTFAPKLPSGRGARQTIQRRIIADRLSKSRQRLIELRYLVEDGPRELWRISTRVEAFRNTDYRQFLAQLQNDLEADLDKHTATGAVRDAKLQICGAVPLISMAQQQLLNDLFRSFLTAFLEIAIAMAVLVRGFAAGLLSMIPNVLPVLAVFGTMGLTGAVIDIGAMMTASTALGIAVDDTLHFLTSYRRAFTGQTTRREAVDVAFQTCATAMTQTSLICGIGLLAFVISPFIPTARFGLLMAILLAAALVAELLVTPAMLVSPLGKYFAPRGKGLVGAREMTGAQGSSQK